MTKIVIAKGLIALVDDENYDIINKWKWRPKFHGKNIYAYRIVTINKVRIKLYMHRVILGLTNPKIVTDHIDHNGLNNQISNLRVCSQSNNSKNRRVEDGRAVKYKGVTTAYKNNFQSRITVDKKVIWLGYFKNEIDAAIAYNNAAKKHHGEYAQINILN